MKYHQNIGWLVVAIVLFSITVGINTGCKQENKKESLQQIDTLENIVNQEQQLLDVDDEGIKARYDSMNIKLHLIREHFKMVMSDSLKNNTLKYLAIRSNYKNFLQVFPGMEYDANEDKKRIDNLKHDYINHTISEKQFQEYYVTEKPLLSKHLASLKYIAVSIYSVRMEFDRSDAVITPVFNLLVAKLKPSVEELKSTQKEEKNGGDDDDDGK